MGKYSGLDTDDMIRIMNDAALKEPCSVEGETAKAYYEHCLEEISIRAKEGLIMQVPNSMD